MKLLLSLLVASLVLGGGYAVRTASDCTQAKAVLVLLELAAVARHPGTVDVFVANTRTLIHTSCPS